VHVYPVSSSQSAARPAERRRNPRHRTSAIIYIRIGPDNGGIVIDLGIDGISCQAARKLNPEGNSNLKLQLHGSGLDADLVGDLVWLGASRKEVGFRFKNPPSEVQQEIANWIKTQQPGYKVAATEDRSKSKPMSAITGISAPMSPKLGISAPEEKPLPRSLSAALAMSQATSVEPSSKAETHAGEASLPAPQDSATETTAAAPLPEIIPPIEQVNTPARELENHPEVRLAEPSISPEQYRKDLTFRSQSLLGLSPRANPAQSPFVRSSPILLAKGPTSPVRERLTQAPAKSQVIGKFRKPEEKKPISYEGVSQSLESFWKGSAIEKWIPPALLAVWKRGNREQKFMLACAGAACLVAFALTLSLAVAHVGSSLGPSTENESSQQSSASPAAAIVSVPAPQPGPLQTPPTPHPNVRPQPGPPPKTLLVSLAEFFLGADPDQDDLPPAIEIDPDRVAVQVWTSKTNGYYYCTDDPFYKSVQPGAFMAQRDALQSGYQPKLGQFCN
jgi:hypothetical protein